MYRAHALTLSILFDSIGRSGSSGNDVFNFLTLRELSFRPLDILSEF